MSLKEKRRLRRQEKGSRITVGKGCWIRHQQILKQQHTNKEYDEDSLVDDLQKTITFNKHGDNSNDMAGTATVVTTVSQTGSVPNEFVPSRGVILDVRIISDALTFLDKSNRLQIPEHLASTLEQTYGAFPQRGTNNDRHNEDRIRKAIANRQENQKHSSATMTNMEPSQSPRTMSSGHNSNHRQYPVTSVSQNLHLSPHPYHPHEALENNMISTQMATTALSISSSSHSGRSLAQNSTITSRRDAFEEESRYVDTSLLKRDPSLRDPAIVAATYYESEIMVQEGFAGSTANGTHLNGLIVPGVVTEPSMLSNAVHESVSPIAGTPQHRNRGAAKANVGTEPASPMLGSNPPMLHLTAMASPSTIGVSLAGSVEAAVPAIDRDHSYPSLRINEAFTTVRRCKKGTTTNKMSRRPSPSPSDVLMTYSVTNNGDTTSSSGSGTRDNSDPSRAASGVSSVHCRRSTPIHRGTKSSQAEQIRRKMVGGNEHKSSVIRDTNSCASRSQSSGSYKDNRRALRHDEGDIYEKSHGSNSISSRSDSRFDRHEVDILGQPMLSNDYSDATSLPSRRTVDEYRRSRNGTQRYDHSREEHDNATSYSVSQADGRGDEYMSPGGRYYQRRDPMAEYEDDVSLSVSSRRDGESTYSRRSYFTSESFVANDDPSMTPSESSEGFLLDPVSTSYRRQHQSQYPQRSPERPAQRSDPPPRASKKEQKKKPPKTRKQRYAPVGIPKGNKGAGIILEQQDSSETDFSELDRWLESAMASKSIEEERSIAESTKEDLDAWLDSVIHR